jgi:drug/metabolite transporter (DMT)-like permease
VFGTFVFVIRLLISSPLSLPMHPNMWLNLLGLGLLPTIVSLVCTAKAIQYIGSTQTALLGAMEPVTAVVLGVIILGEAVSFRDILGMILIFVAVTLVVCRRK